MGIYLRVFAGLAINITPTSFYPSQDSCSLRVSPLRIIRLLPLVISLFSARLESFKKLVVHRSSGKSLVKEGWEYAKLGNGARNGAHFFFYNAPDASAAVREPCQRKVRRNQWNLNFIWVCMCCSNLICTSMFRSIAACSKPSPSLADQSRKRPEGK